jgi:hypothetical protein
MQMYAHLWYLAKLFLKWETFQTKVVEKIKVHVLHLILFPKIMQFVRYAKKCGRARHITDDNIIWCMRLCWITEATDTHSEYVILTAFPWQQWLHVAPQCYVIHMLPVLSIWMWNICIAAFLHNAWWSHPGYGMLSHANVQLHGAEWVTSFAAQGQVTALLCSSQFCIWTLWRVKR